MTWLFVRTTPDDVRTMPVPAAWPWPPARVVVISTTDGATFVAMPFWLGRGFCVGCAPAWVVVKPMTPAPTTSAAAAARPRNDRRGRGGGGDASGLVMVGTLATEPLSRLCKR